jgi:hypothetical protein
MITEPSPYYFFYGKLGIISDAPGAEEAIKQCPDLEVKTLEEWKNIELPPCTGGLENSSN